MSAYVAPQRYQAARERLKADPIIRQIAGELVAFATPRERMAHPGVPAVVRGGFMLDAVGEYERRCRREGRAPVESHLGGPAEAILELFDEAQS